MNRVLLMAVLLSCAACSDPVQTRWEYAPDMADSVAADPFDAAPYLPEGRVAQPSPAGSLARGEFVFPYDASPEAAVRAGAELTNPVPADSAAKKRGEQVFRTICACCHGPLGEGDGPVAAKFQPPPPFKDPRVKALPDGTMFHVITRGKGSMAAHALQVLPEDRWKVIHHIRTLQEPAK